MPRFEITSPDGKKFEINAPEGATQEQALAYAQQQFSKQASAPQEGYAPKTAQDVVAHLKNPENTKIVDVPGIMEKGAYRIGGAVTDATGSPEAGFAANVGVQAIPTVLGGGIGKFLGKAGTASGEKLMRMALKPSSTIAPEKSARVIKTMLTEDAGGILPGANVTRGGVDRLQEVLKKKTLLEDSLIANNAGKTVNKFDVAKAGQSADDVFSNQVAPVADKNAIAGIIDEFLNKNPKVPSRTPAQVIPPQQVQSPIVNAQGQNFTQTIPGRTIPASGTDEIPVAIASELKKGTYKILGDKAYSGELKSAETSVQKALASGLRKELQAQIPDLVPVNQHQSDLINAIKVAISRNAVSGNKDPIGLGFIAANPKAAAAFMANRSEFVKSLLARILYNTSEATGTATGAAAGGYMQQSRDNAE